MRFITEDILHENSEYPEALGINHCMLGQVVSVSNLATVKQVDSFGSMKERAYRTLHLLFIVMLFC